MNEGMAGIIPIAGHKSDIDLPWHHVLMPFDKNKTLIQHAVYNCAMAGCDSIWIVCNDDQQPLVRKIIGERVEDPVYKYRAHTKYASQHKRFIPVFYSALPIRDQQKRNHIVWVATFGCLLANKIFGAISKYTAPERFFICWPYAIIESDALRPLRKNMRKESFAFSSYGKNIHTEDFLPFVCDIEHVRALKEHCYILQSPNADCGRFEELTMSHVLSPLKNLPLRELEYYYRKVSNWKEYCDFFE